MSLEAIEYPQEYLGCLTTEEAYYLYPYGIEHEVNEQQNKEK